MANEITATASVSFSPTPSVQLLGASSTIVESPTTKRFVRLVGGADTADNQLPLGPDYYDILGGTPAWLWVKNIDASGSISIKAVNDDQISSSLGLEIMRLLPGEAILMKIGRDTDAEGELSGSGNFKIVGSGPTFYDAVITAA